MANERDALKAKLVDVSFPKIYEELQQERVRNERLVTAIKQAIVYTNVEKNPGTRLALIRGMLAADLRKSSVGGAGGDV